MENPAVAHIRKRSSKSRSRSNTPVQKHFLSSSDEGLLDAPAMNTRSTSRCSSRECFVLLEDSVYQKYKTSDYSSEDGEISPILERTRIDNENKRNGHKEQQQKERDLLAYKEYHEAGEYWNKYPKTDYTYSKRSPHRRELASGSVALPNMSRPSLHGFDERMEKQKLSDNVAFIDKCTSKTYSHLTNTKTNIYTTSSPNYTRYSESYRSNYSNLDNLRFNGRDVADIRYTDENVGLFSKLWLKGTNAARWTKSWFVEVDDVRYRTPVSRRQMNEERGYLSRIYSSITNTALWFMTWVYWLIGSVLVLDCKLLCGRETPPRSRTKSLILLLLLPLLLLCAWWLYVHPYEDLIAHTQSTSDFIQSLPQRSVDGLSYSSNIIADIFQSPWSYITHIFASILDLTSYLFESACAIIANLFTNLLSIPSYLYSLVGYILDFTVQNIKSIGDFLVNLAHSFWLWLYGAAVYLKTDPKIEESSHFENIKSEIKLDLSHDDLNRRIDLYVSNYLKNNERIFLTPEYVTKITDVIKNEINLQQKDFMNQGFIERLAVLVKANLDLDANKFVLTPIHIQQISDALNNGDLNININKFDTSKLIQELMKNPLLQNFIIQSNSLNVDKSFMENQQNVLFDLEKQIRANKLEIENLKNSNIDNGDTIDKLQNVINELKSQQNILRDDIVLVQKQSAEGINNLNAEFRKLLSDILGFDVNNDASGFKIWMNSAFVAKDVLENRLNKLNEDVRSNSKATVDASSAILMKHVGDSIKAAILRYNEEQKTMITNLKNEFKNTNNFAFEARDFNEFDVQKIVQAALVKYDADKTGLVDYALESAGGQVLSTRCTETYSSRTAQYVWFGIPLWYSSNSPRTAITPGTHPGQCWAFQGFPGYLVLKLSMPVQVTGFTMEHASRQVVANGNIDSAPKNFSVWGLQSIQDPEPVLFGYFEYLDNSTSLQYFPVMPTELNQDIYEMVELRVESNHGNPVFSCLYRFRVHGNPQIIKNKVEQSK